VVCYEYKTRVSWAWHSLGESSYSSGKVCGTTSKLPNQISKAASDPIRRARPDLTRGGVPIAAEAREHSFEINARVMLTPL
jgi:hypothetical protein